MGGCDVFMCVCVWVGVGGGARTTDMCSTFRVHPVTSCDLWRVRHKWASSSRVPCPWERFRNEVHRAEEEEEGRGGNCGCCGPETAGAVVGRPVVSAIVMCGMDKPRPPHARRSGGSVLKCDAPMALVSRAGGGARVSSASSAAAGVDRSFLTALTPALDALRQFDDAVVGSLCTAIKTLGHRCDVLVSGMPLSPWPRSRQSLPQIYRTKGGRGGHRCVRVREVGFCRSGGRG